jgi:hypothetical protein
MKRKSDLPFHWTLFQSWVPLFVKTLVPLGVKRHEDSPDKFEFTHKGDDYEVKIRKLPRK